MVLKRTQFTIRGRNMRRKGVMNRAKIIAYKPFPLSRADNFGALLKW
jgi:hypothetical protein